MRCWKIFPSIHFINQLLYGSSNFRSSSSSSSSSSLRHCRCRRNEGEKEWWSRARVKLIIYGAPGRCQGDFSSHFFVNFSKISGQKTFLNTSFAVWTLPRLSCTMKLRCQAQRIETFSSTSKTTQTFGSRVKLRAALQGATRLGFSINSLPARCATAGGFSEVFLRWSECWFLG